MLAVENGWEEEPGSYWQVLCYQTKSMSSVKSVKKKKNNKVEVWAKYGNGGKEFLYDTFRNIPEFSESFIISRILHDTL